MEPNKTLLIVDDHTLLRATMRELLHTLNPDLEILEACSGEVALQLVQVSHPNIVLMDIDLPGMNGILTTKQITKTSPDTKVIMLTMLDSVEYINAAQEDGAKEFIPKSKMHIKLMPIINAFLSDGNEDKLMSN